MKITFDWIKDHLDTKFKEDKLLEQLTNVGLEVVEGVLDAEAGGAGPGGCDGYR